MKWSSGSALKLALGRTAGFVATFFIPLLLVRVFEPAEFGTYKQLFLLYATVYPLAQLGMAESLFYFLPAERERGGRYVVNAMLTLAASGTLCLMLLWLLRGRIAVWMSNERLADLVPFVGIYLLCMLLSSVLEITLISGERYERASLTYAASDITRAGLLLLPALLLVSVRWVMVGAVTFAALRLLVTLVQVRASFKGGLQPSAGAARAQVLYTAPFQLAVVFEIVQMNAPHFAVSHVFDAATYAIFAVGCLQLPLTDFIASSVCNVLMVKVREASRAGRRRAVIRLWRAATRDLAFVFVPLAGLLWLVADDLVVLLFTEDYRAAVPVFMIWTGTVLLSVFQTDGILRALAEMRFLVLVNAVRLVTVVVFLAWLMPGFGLEGAVLAAVVALATGKALSLLRLRQVLGVPLARLLPWPVLARTAIAASLAAAPAAAVGWLAGAPALISMLGLAVTYGVAYLVAAALLDVLPESLRAALVDWWRPFSSQAVQQGE